MRQLRITLQPEKTSIHPVADVFLAGERVERAEVWHWNIRTPLVTLLFYVVGARDPLRTVLEQTPEISEFEIVGVDDRSFYLYLLDETTSVVWQLFEAFSQEGLIGLPPATYEDGSLTVTLLGDQQTLSDALASVPAGIDVELQRIGEYSTRGPDGVAGLSERQREALLPGLACGYYEVPRTGSHADVADAMGCAPSTAAEHLQKAEATLVQSVLGSG